MKFSPLNIRCIHFVGIGGIGMSGIAEVLHHKGYTITGSDLSENNNVKRLTSLGVKVYHAHHSTNITGAEVVVISSAVKPDNPEVKEALSHKIPVIKRAEMLAELMRMKWAISVAGSHGKTTTTSYIATMLKTANADPTVVNGGIIKSFGSNAYRGRGEIMVAEADESDGTFQYLPSTMCVVTNIDPEHMAYYKTLEHLKQAFAKFIDHIPFYGVAVMCGDDKNTKRLMQSLPHKRVIAYGFQESNDVRAVNIRQTLEGSYFDVEFSDQCPFFKKGPVPAMKDIHLAMPGYHNILNALATICIGQELGIEHTVMKKALSEFDGVQRRFTILSNGSNATIVDDYAHHPTEIKAVIAGALSIKKGKLYIVFQPHRYSRLEDHYEDFVHAFAGADQVYILPVYAAGEVEKSINSLNLTQSIVSTGVNVQYAPDYPGLKVKLLDKLNPEDMVIFMGAGDVTHWAHAFAEDYKNMLS